MLAELSVLLCPLACRDGLASTALNCQSQAPRIVLFRAKPNGTKATFSALTCENGAVLAALRPRMASQQHGRQTEQSGG